MEYVVFAYIISMLLWAARELNQFLWSRRHKTVICQYEWCTFAAISDRDQSELVYVAMNQHLQQEHGSGPWANAVLNSSD